MTHCTHCHAPEGERVWRSQTSTDWTQSLALVQEDLDFYPNATMIWLDKDGKCHKCRQQS